MVHIEDVLLHSLAQSGDRYVFLTQPRFDDADPDEFDCSGLVSWSCHRAGVPKFMPHSSFMQCQICMRHAPSLELSVADGVATRGALLFKFRDAEKRPITDVLSLVTRPASAHVAWSLGDGTTIEAMGTKWGVGVFSANPVSRGWTHAGLLPGVDYTDRPEIGHNLTHDQNQNHTIEEDEMTRVMFFAGPNEGEVQAYVVNGLIAKHLPPASLDLHNAFGTPTHGSIKEPLGRAWQDAWRSSTDRCAPSPSSPDASRGLRSPRRVRQ
jgi:cell wall-associated NlpC family hydrolase